MDENNGDKIWKYANEKEVKNVRAAFKIITIGGKPPPGYHKILCHMIFDINMEDLGHKARFVAGGHVTEPPATINYASAVSRETISIVIAVAALNYLQVMMAYIHNSYIQSPVAEKIWAVLGP